MKRERDRDRENIYIYIYEMYPKVSGRAAWNENCKLYVSVPLGAVLSLFYDGCSNGVPPIHFSQTEHRIHFRARPMRFLDFSNHEKGALRQEISR
jgi:hypothetical protein